MGGILLFGQNQASETSVQSLYQLQNFKILLTLWGHKNPRGQNIWNWNFFYLKRQGYRYYYRKNQVEPTSSSYINLTTKLLIKL